MIRRATIPPMLEATKQLGNYLQEFSRFEKSLGAKRSWVHSLRQAAMQRFAERGFPTTKDEEWRFTSVAPIVTKKPRRKPPAHQGCSMIAIPAAMATRVTQSRRAILGARRSALTA